MQRRVNYAGLDVEELGSIYESLLDYHPQAIKVPYNHSNLDSDEVLYYVAGNFGSRKCIEIGSLTLHPQGIPHGPHPGTIEASLSATALLTRAFRTLRDPVSRGLYWLELHNEKLASDNKRGPGPRPSCASS